MKKLTLYKCDICGNQICMVEDSGVVPSCCREDMRHIRANTQDAAREKHIPDIERRGRRVHIAIGSEPHPMTGDHHIEWIVLLTARGLYCRGLTAGDAPGAEFTVPEDDRFYDHYDSFYGQWNHNGDLYCAMLPQIVPYSVSGIVWYEGESDVTTSEALIYKDELLAMIGLWRSDFLDPDLPFYVIQIADCDDRAWPCWTAIQRAQADAADDGKKVFCIISRDVCESNTIHPTRKYELSKRLADKICEIIL